jgi:GntR family transcriptional regulator of arabinose operon
MQAENLSKHDEVYRVLEERILGGQWSIGSQIPTEMQLSAEFGCSRSTTGKAIARLVHEGLVERKTRTGTRVIRHNLHRNKSLLDLNAYAFIYPSRQHEGVWRTVKGFQAAAETANRRVMMLSTGADYSKEAEFIGRLAEFDVRAGAIFPVLSTPEDVVHFSKMLIASKFPIVLTEIGLPGLGCPAVVVDGFHAGYTMTRHLVERGAKRIGYFSNYSWAPFMKDRFRGYAWAMDEAGLPARAEAIMLDPRMHPNFDDPLAEPKELARTYLKKAGMLDAVVCSDDYLALGCIAAAKEAGVEVPRDLLVTGIDDYQMASHAAVPLTSYHIPYEEVGRKAFEILEALTANPGAERSFSETQIRGRLIVRETA